MNEARAPTRATLPEPPIGLYYRQRRTPEIDEGFKLKLKSNPGDPNSSDYTFFIRYLKPNDSDPEYYADWVIDLKKVIQGQNLMAGPPRYRLVRDLLQGRHLFDFNTFATELGAETIPHFEECIRRLGRQIWPKQSKSRQIFWLRNSMKPDSMTIRQYVGRLRDISTKCDAVWPLDLEEEEWKDILINAMPSHYVRRMFAHGFDPDDHDFIETMDILERFETADNIGKAPRRAPARSSRTTRTTRRRGNRNDNRRGNRFDRDRGGDQRSNFRNRRNFRGRNNFQRNRPPFRNPQNRSDFRSNRRYNSNSNNQDANRRSNGNNNFSRGGSGNNFRRNRGRNFRGGDRANRNQQEANALDVLRRSGTESDTSL